MAATSPPVRQPRALRAALAARAADGRLILVGEVVAAPARSRLGRSLLEDAFIESVRGAGLKVPFVLIACLTDIRIFRWDGKTLSEPVFVASAPDILAAYDPDFAHKPVFDAYLIALVEGWLRDVAYHWKSANPPGLAALEAAGVAPLLIGGTTERDVLIRIEPAE